MLNVFGHSGVGKSALLRAFVRTAKQLGKTAILVDSRDFPSTAEGLLGAIGHRNEEEAFAHLNETRPLILLDTFEEVGDLQHYLHSQFLPRLDTRVNLVVAGRYPLGMAWNDDSLWRRIVRPLPLGAFSPTEGREYLRRRGLHERALVEPIMSVAAGNPLALSLAADMALQLDIRDFAVAPEWHLVVRSLVERLLRDVKDSQLRELLYACAVVRQFDEATLAAVAGQEDIGGAFDRLCRLSVVRCAEHGLMLHDDIRRTLADDLRWRRPDRYNAMRLRALAYYRQRVRSAPPSERAWLVAERLFLWENSLVQTMLFGEEEPGQVWVEPARPEDHAAIRRLWAWWLKNVLLQAVEFDGELPADGEFLAAILRYPGTRVRVARDRDGRVLGFSTSLPVCRESLPLLDLHPAFAPLVHAYWSPHDLAALPATSAGANTWYSPHLGHGEVLPDTTRAMLLRDRFGMHAAGGTHAVAASLPDIRVLLEACGFQRVPGARNWAFGPRHPVDGYVLDLSHIGPEAWIEAILSGRQLPLALGQAELQRELQSALLHWRDDSRLARSPLAHLPAAPAVGSEAERPGAVRHVILQALAQARAGAPESRQEAYRALELAYIQKSTSHEVAAERLAVSRATFYRLLRRGIQGLAETLSQP